MPRTPEYPPRRVTRTFRPAPNPAKYPGGSARGPYAPAQQATRYDAPPQAYQEEPAAPARAGKKARNSQKGFPVWTLPVIILCLGALAFMGWWVWGEYGLYQENLSVQQAVSRPGFHEGITIDGISISGLTLEQAQGMLAERNNQSAQDFALTVTNGERQWRITAEELPLSFNANALLEWAYAIGRSGSLKSRHGVITALKNQGVDIQSEMSFDESRVDELVGIIAERLNVPVQDAALEAFDPLNKAFLFKDPQPGYAIDEGKLKEDILAALSRKDFSAPIQVTGGPVQPTGDASLMTTQYGLIASFTTDTTNDSNRNNNIRLSAEALNGQMIAPNAVFSFNECTGQRTSAKGYLEAGAISGGQLIDAFGGGVCQTSSTLFNAVVRANMPIESRSKHSWPSSYVPRGEDAAVDWPNLDFKFRNNQDTPIFLIAWYDNKKITVEVYGRRLPEGMQIDLVSDTLQVLEPSSEIVYTRKEDMTPGTQKEGKKKRTGYVVDTYKVFYQDGTPIAKEKLWTTTYNAVQKEIYYN